MKKLPQILLVLVTIIAVLLGLWVKALQGALASNRASYEDQIAKANQIIRDLHSQAELKTLPLHIGHRAATVAQGGVLMIENRGEAAMAIKLAVSRPDGSSRDFDFVLNANMTHPFGGMEGWSFVSGDTFEITSTGYHPIRGKYP